MSDGKLPQTTTPANGPQWDEELVYFILHDSSRRKLLLTLAKHGPKTASDLLDSGAKVGVSYTSTQRLDVTLKHLVCMRKSGLVVKKENPRDGRRALYALSPALPVVHTPTGAYMDFGFCTVQLKG